MTLTRKMLKAMGIEDEKIDQIIEAHGETVDALKEQRDAFKADAEKLVSVEQELGKAQKQLEETGKDAFKVKYEALKEEFDAFKNDIELKNTQQAKEKAFRELLKEAGVNEKRFDSIIKVSDLNDLEIVDGKFKDAEKITENIKNEWADFIQTETQKGADVATPPTTVQGKVFSIDEIKKMTPAEINQNFDAIKASLKGAN